MNLSRIVIGAVGILLITFTTQCFAIDVLVKNKTNSTVRVKLIANAGNANAHLDVPRMGSKNKNITPPQNSDQVIIAWKKGGKLIGHSDIQWEIINKASKIIVIITNDGVAVDFELNN